MGRSGIEQMLYMMDHAFDGRPEGTRSWNALMVNLNSVRDEDWTWLPEAGERTIRSLVLDLGVCKHVYASRGFEDGSMDWSKPGTVPMPPRGAPKSEVISWLRGAHQHLRACVEALDDDAELLQPRPAPQGGLMETRWLIKTMIEHDLYHCGEINHIRALSQRNDGPGNEPD